MKPRCLVLFCSGCAGDIVDVRIIQGDWGRDIAADSASSFFTIEEVVG